MYLDIKAEFEGTISDLQCLIDELKGFTNWDSQFCDSLAPGSITSAGVAEIPLDEFKWIEVPF